MRAGENTSRIWRIVVAVAIVAMLAPMFVAGAKAGPVAAQGNDLDSASQWAAPRTVYIPETGHSIDGVFLDYWRYNGGVSSFGNPITPEFNLNGHVVQYFQYARFEYWPEDADGNVVHLGKIGEELRPQLFMRQQSAAVTSSIAETARVSLAWLPVTDNVASQPNTDTFVYVPETGHTIANGFKGFWDNSGGVEFLGNPLTEEYRVGEIVYQVFERGQLAWKQNTDPWMVAVGGQLAARQGISTDKIAQGDIPTYDEALFVEPEPEVPVFDPGKDLMIEINLSEQYMTVWNGGSVLFGTYVSTGREGFETPTGTYYINSMNEGQTMEGVLGGEYYNVPDVPWVMYFTDRGHAIHGAYWHNNFGSVMSHGCVNLPVDLAAYLWSITTIGTRVEIHY
jgi:lipoprotein-anchoring transpeptidase ErfK/SrfK